MGARGLLALLLVLAGLGLALWLSEESEPVDPQLLTENVLDGRSVVDALRIVVHPDPDLLGIELERSGAGEWLVVEPIRDLASIAWLENVRIAYDSAQLVVAYEPEQVDERLLEETGLDVPRGSIRVEWPDGKVVELQIGLPGPYGNGLFARRGDAGASQRIYRVQRALMNALQVTPTDVRERGVFRTRAGQLLTLRVTRRGAATDGAEDVIALRRRGTNWQMLEPADLRLDQGQTGGFAEAVLGLRIDEFLPGRPQPGLAPIGPEAPADVTIEVSGGPTPERVALYFVGDRQALIGVNDARDLWFSCEVRGYREVLEAPIRALRAYGLFSSSIDELRSIRLAAPDARVIELERRGAGEYRLARPIAFAADATAVSELLQGMRSLAVIQFAADGVTDFGPYGLGDGALSLQVGVRPGRSERLLIGGDTGDASTFARRADEPHVVTVPRAAVERLRRPWWSYVDRRVLKIEDGGRVRRIVRSLADGTKVEFVRGDDGEWRREGQGDPLPLVEDTFELLRDLRGVEVAPDDAFGEIVDEGALELIAGSGQVLGRLALARAGDDRGLCSVAEAPGVRFVLRARDSRDLLALR